MAGSYKILCDLIRENIACLPNELVFIIGQYALNFPIVFMVDRKLYALFINTTKTNATSQNETDTTTSFVILPSPLFDNYYFHWYNQESGLIFFYAYLDEGFQTYQISMNPLTIRQIDTPDDVKMMRTKNPKIIGFPGITQFPNDKAQQILECVDFGFHIVCKLSDSDILIVNVDDENQKLTYHCFDSNNILKVQKLKWNYPKLNIRQKYSMFYLDCKLQLIIENDIFTTTLNLPIKIEFQPVWDRCRICV